MECTCTVFFENPFWVAVFERVDHDGYSVARTVFGSEPSDPQLLEFALRHYPELKFSQSIESIPASANPAGYKRRQREIRRRMAAEKGPGTRAQQALKAEEERHQVKRAQSRREEQILNEAEKFHLRQEKKKARQRGR